MNSSIFTLVPERVQFDQFWVEIRKRNRWLILMRYGAVVLLASLILGIDLLRAIFINLTVDTLPLWIIAFAILSYNILLHILWNYLARKRGWKQGNHTEPNHIIFRSLHFSLLQIVIDFIALMLFIYYTGGVETPLYVFFIFHVVIGSLFLPGAIVNMIISATLLITATGAILELNGIIHHHAIGGFLSQPLYNNNAYLIVFFVFFGISLYLTTYLANSVSRDLYSRERELTLAYDELNEAEKAKSRYVMSVVHDLKTPVAAAITYLNMLLDGTLGALLEDHKKPVERSKERLKGAINEINDILYISQLKLDADMEEITDIGLKELFDEIIDETRVLLTTKNIDFRISFLPDENITLHGGRKLIKLALSNLVSNAIKYNVTDGIIEVMVRDSGESLSIKISDSGIGIPLEEKDKIFEDFYRSTISKKKGIEGSGLGMSIVLQIIKRNRGKIEVESPSYLRKSEEEPGTSFTIEFPKIIN